MPLNEIVSTSLFNDPALVGYWRFEGNSSASKSGSIFTGLDRQMTYPEGMFGSGAFFNGYSSSISLTGDTSSLKPTGPFTIMAWIYNEKVGGNQTIFESYFQSTQVSGIKLYITTKLILLSGKNSGTGYAIDYYDHISTNLIPTRSWTHVAGRWTGTQLQVFINGLPEPNPTDWSNAPVYVVTSSTRIGCDTPARGSDGNFYSGSIDDLVIFNRALSETEILGYNRYTRLRDTRFFNDPSMSAYWEFESNSTASVPTGNTLIATDTAMTYSSSYGKFDIGPLFNGTTSKIVLTGTTASAMCPTGPFTIIGWVKTSEIGNYREIVESYTQNPNPAGFEFRKTNTNKLQLVSGRNLNLTLGSGFQLVTSNASANGGEYIHVAARWNSTQLQLFINGVLDASTSWSFAPVYAPGDTRCRIGVNNLSGATNTYFWTGSIDDLAIFQRALTNAEILESYFLPPPTASFTFPDAGNIGDVIFLTGSRFTGSFGSCSVTIQVTGSATASILSFTNDSLTFLVPSGTGYGSGTLYVTQQLSSHSSNSIPFSVINAPWYSPFWEFRKKIIVQPTQVSQSVANFPLLVSSSDSNLLANARSDGNDILFTDKDGITLLPFELESYNAGNLVAWVKSPLLLINGGEYVYMYYGNPSQATSLQSSSLTWSGNNYVSVWHLNGNPIGPPPQFSDSTANGFNLTTSGTFNNSSSVTGHIDGAISRSGFTALTSSQQTESFQFTDTSSLTVSAWVKPLEYGELFFANPIAGGLGIFSTRDTPAATEAALFITMMNVPSAGTGACFVYGAAATASGVKGSTNIALNKMYYIVGTFTYTGVGTAGYQGLWNIYVNGVKDGATNNFNVAAPGGVTLPISGGIWKVTKEWNIAGTSSGIYDEIRVANTARSASWILTEYNNQYSPTSFYSMSSQESTSSTQPPGVASQFIGINYTTSISQFIAS